MKFHLALALALAGSPAAAASQFDLLCTSKYHDAEFHYRVDLDANQWCATSETRDIWGKRASDTRCAPTMFSGIGADVLLFDSFRPYHFVDRVTGEWQYKDQGEGYVGTCVAAPFSGFPAIPTKF